MLLALLLAAQTAAPNIVTNGDFEQGLEGWTIWTREPDVGAVDLDHAIRHSGANAARIDHSGDRDWSFAPWDGLPVNAGDRFELTGALRVAGEGSATIGVITYDADAQALDWAYADRSVTDTSGEWARVSSEFVVQPGVERIVPRLVGDGPASVWLDDFALAARGSVMRDRADLPRTWTVENARLAVTVETTDGRLTVRDKCTQDTWEQSSGSTNVMVTGATRTGDRIDLTMIHTSTAREIRASVELVADTAEFTVELNGEGDLDDALAYPHPFTTRPGDRVIVPMNEGISYPVDDDAVDPMRLIAYGGHGISMSFWGVTRGPGGHMAIIETPDDAAIRIERADGLLAVEPEWVAQKGAFGYARRLRYVFFDDGGYVAMCKRYREHAKEEGRFRTLREKRDANPNVDRLIGAVNVWCWEGDAPAWVEELRDQGIERILWSHREDPDSIRRMNEMGVLTSRYDIVQDVMDPANFPNLNWVHSDWPTEAWPADLMIDSDGEWIRGWGVRAKDGELHPCGVVCDMQAVSYMRARLATELADHPYLCRFIDTTTATPWRECYDPVHPVTRGESRHWKMELLRSVSEGAGLVTGSETGHDAAVPYVDYFEGMLSLGPYRVPDAGRDMIKPWDVVPERVAKFQVGHEYRLPLWELVYHDCVVAQWYWGDYNNKLPSVWERRDLFNMLYGTPPMFMFNREIWEANKERFARSYADVSAVARAVGYAEMTDHRFLTDDGSVQRTEFANGVTVTVNFGDEPFQTVAGAEIAPLGHRVDGI